MGEERTFGGIFVDIVDLEVAGSQEAGVSRPNLDLGLFDLGLFDLFHIRQLFVGYHTDGFGILTTMRTVTPSCDAQAFWTLTDHRNLL
jgi:hypothetical protein